LCGFANTIEGFRHRAIVTPRAGLFEPVDLVLTH